MNNKRQQIHNYQQLNLKNKNKQSKQPDRNRIIGMEIIWRVISWERKEENGGEDAGIKKHNW